MRKLKPIVADSPEELAGALGLSGADAKEWQVQHMLLKRLKEIAQSQSITHATSLEAREAPAEPVARLGSRSGCPVFRNGVVPR
jgi:hypothetical protein